MCVTGMSPSPHCQYRVPLSLHSGNVWRSLGEFKLLSFPMGKMKGIKCTSIPSFQKIKIRIKLSRCHWSLCIVDTRRGKCKIPNKFLKRFSESRHQIRYLMIWSDECPVVHIYCAVLHSFVDIPPSTLTFPHWRLHSDDISTSAMSDTTANEEQQHTAMSK